MESVTAPEPYPRLRRRLVFIRLRQWVRSACDLTGFGSSSAGRLCCVLILGAVLFGAILALSFLMRFSPGIAVSLALTAFLLVLFSGCALTLLGSDANLASDREQLLRKLPQAKAAWEAYKERLRAKRAAAAERLREAKADRARAGSGRSVAEAELPGPRTYEIEVVAHPITRGSWRKLVAGAPKRAHGS
jgi:hypothetical protein